MTIRTVLRSRLVEKHRLVLNVTLQRVAQRTTHICVRACQWKLSALIVVKRGRLPALVHMALGAAGNSILGGKLRAVRIAVTRLTIGGRTLELNFVRARLRFVTFVTRDSTMPAE